jgi:hypothetical protein
MNKKKNFVSIHEAAHVVGAIEFGHSFIYATIIPDEKANSLGHVLTKLPKKVKDALDIGDANPFVCHYAKEEMIILLVGQAAESRILKIPFKNGKLPQKQYSLKVDKMFNFKTVKHEKKHI